MVRTITTKRIIGDINVANFLEKKYPKDSEINEIMDEVTDLNYNRPFLPIVIRFQLYIILNTGINCFSDELVTDDEKIIPDSGITFKNKSKKLTDLYNSDILNGVLTTIKMKSINGRYYTVEDDYDFRIVTSILYKEYYTKIPEIILKMDDDGEYELIKPQVVYPNSLSVCMSNVYLTINDCLKPKTTSKKIGYNIFYILLVLGHNLKMELFENMDIIYIKPINNNIDTLKLKEGASRNDYALLCRTFFEKEYSDYLALSFSIKLGLQKGFGSICNKICDCCTEASKHFKKNIENGGLIVFKEGNNFYQKGDENFLRIESEMRKCNYIMTFCEVANVYVEASEMKLLIEVFPVEEFFGKIDSPKKSQKSPQIPLISEEDARKNADELLALDELDKKQKIQKKSKKKEKEKAKKEVERNLEKLKSLAKTIALEAKSYFNKFNNLKNKRINAENNKKKIASKLAYEAKEYLESKKLPDFFPPTQKEDLCELEESYEIITNDDNSHCEIGSEEFYRRVHDWNLLEIIPQIYCLPKKEIISLFIEPKEKLWAFELW